MRVSRGGWAITIRPMSFTEIFDLSFELLKKNFLLIFGVVFVLYSIPAFAPRWLFPELFVFPPKQGVDPTPQLWLHGYSIIVTGLVSFVSSFIAFVLFDAMTEERIDLRSSFRSSIEVLPSLIWTLFICFLCFIGVCLAFGLWCAFVLFLVSVLSPLGPEMFLILLLVGLFLGAFFVIPRLVFLPQLVAIERISGFAAVRRAWSLTKGSVLHMAGIFLCIWLVTALVPGIFLLTLGPHTPAPVQLVTTLVMTVTTAFSIIVFTVSYLELRARKEGLDLELLAASVAIATNEAKDAEGNENPGEETGEPEAQEP